VTSAMASSTSWRNPLVIGMGFLCELAGVRWDCRLLQNPDKNNLRMSGRLKHFSRPLIEAFS
jgi:hypothetical protein